MGVRGSLEAIHPSSGKGHFEMLQPIPMGPLLRLPAGPAEHFGGASPKLAVSLAGPEGLCTWRGTRFWACHGSATDHWVLATPGREPGRTRFRRMLGRFSVSFPGATWSPDTLLSACFVPSPPPPLPCCLFSAAPQFQTVLDFGFPWCRYWPFLYLTLLISSPGFSESRNISI